MFAFLAGWPDWSIAALIGGVVGALAGVLGYAIGRRSRTVATICTVVGVIASQPLVNTYLMPIIANDVANADLPKKIDEVTTMTRVEIERHKVRYFFTLDESVPQVTSEQLKTDIGVPACAFWKPQFQSGKYESAEYSYEFKPSGTAGFTLTPADCP